MKIHIPQYSLSLIFKLAKENIYGNVFVYTHIELRPILYIEIIRIISFFSFQFLISMNSFISRSESP